jgi:glycosyltransferase involved in cell wall biosynthesis
VVIYIILIFAGIILFAAGIVLPFVTQRLPRTRGSAASPLSILESSASLEVVIPAYLESSVIGETIISLNRQLKSWPGPASITVVASDDATAAASGNAGKVLSVGRNGKPAACNIAVEGSKADVIVFTDANCRINPENWPVLLRGHLSRWGVVSANKTELGGSDGAFWSYESKIKKLSESGAGSLAVVGEFMAFRRLDYRPIPNETQLDDFWIALDFNRRNLGVGVATDILTIEEASRPRDQWERRIRMTAGVLYEAIPNVPWLARTAVGQNYLAHKLYRSTVGALGFWMAVIAFSLLFPPATFILALLAVLWSLAVYTGRTTLGSFFKPFFTLVALQAVIFLAAGRALRRLFQARYRSAQNTGWTKIAR